jgi:hypothetical protein
MNLLLSTIIFRIPGVDSIMYLLSLLLKAHLFIHLEEGGFPEEENIRFL